MKQDRNKRPSRQRMSPDQPHPPALSRGRYWCFAIVASLGLPLLLLLLLEMGLRLAGYGHPTSFFKSISIGSDNYHVENAKFGLSFFPPELARSPAPVRMPAAKSPDTCRIFLLGESAALGDPRPAYGPGRYLQALLEERFPGKRFEVICVAMTAINSHAILPMARECCHHQPDAWIVYMGNNEMVGPFGATTVFGMQAPSRTLVQLSLALQRLRLGQWLGSLARKWRTTPHSTSWGGMKMFLASAVGPKDAAKERVYRSFAANLRDILDTLRHSGAPVILNSVAVNLRDCPPFAWQTRTNRLADEQAAFLKISSEAEQAADAGDNARAAASFEKALQMDPDNALLEFRLGAALTGTDPKAARAHFQRACDSDMLPFRADSRINGVISEAAGKTSAHGVTFCDAAGLFASSSPAASPGHEALLEHVHFNFDGNYLLARAWAEQLAQRLPALGAGTNSAWASQEACEQRLGLTDWNRAAVLQDLLRRLNEAPFTNQLHQAQRLEFYRGRLRETRARLDTAAAARARALYQNALKQAPDDHRLHENYAEFLEAVGDTPAAAGEWRRVSELIPQHHVAFFQTGRLLARQGKTTDARVALNRSVALRPDLAEGWLELGKLNSTEGKFQEALDDFERQRQLAPNDSRLFYERGRALSKLGRRAEAIGAFEQAVALKPDYWEAHYTLGEELAFDGKGAKARQQFELVTRLRPSYPMAHFNLGVALTQQGRLDEAAHQFQETLRLDANNKLASNYLDKVQHMKSAAQRERPKSQ